MELHKIQSAFRRGAQTDARPWNQGLPITILVIALASMMGLHRRVEAPGAEPSVYAWLASNLNDQDHSMLAVMMAVGLIAAGIRIRPVFGK